MWHHDAVLYQLDPSLFLDSDGDGTGDLRGVVRKLEYIRSLGVSTLWLLPIYDSPFRDGGYDITDHLRIAPRFGDVADFSFLLERAQSLGMRVLVELVMQHTSDQHHWFQSARADRRSKYRDYYLWAEEPPDDGLEPVFEGVEDSVWSFDAEAGQYYRHMFYRHEPDLDLANPRVREELFRIMAFWLDLGVDGFRIDAVPYMIERARAADPRDDGLWLLKQMHDFAWKRSPGAILMGEADVDARHYRQYFGDHDRLTHLLDFWTNNQLFLALARRRAQPLEEAMHDDVPPALRRHCAVWLRNHDELDLDRLQPDEREDVLRVFAPERSMRVYGQGIRRRLAPMLEGDPRRLAMAHALLLSLPGTPVLRYGDEIGMGDDLSLPQRTSVRTPMQWHAGHNAGFSSAEAGALPAPVIADGPFAYARVNVQDQQWAAGSLLSRVRGLVQAQLALPETGHRWRQAKFDCPSVFGLRYDAAEGDDSLLVFANLDETDVAFDVREDDLTALVEVACDAPYPANGLTPLQLRGYGYRWLRRRHG